MSDWGMDTIHDKAQEIKEGLIFSKWVAIVYDIPESLRVGAK